MKNLIAIIVGLIAASITVYIFEHLIGPSIFPLPKDALPLDMEWLTDNMSRISRGTKLFVVIAHFIGIVVGMFVAAKISTKSIVPSYIIGVLMLAGTFFYIVVLPKELWFTLADGLLVIVGFFLGQTLAATQLTRNSYQ